MQVHAFLLQIRQSLAEGRDSTQMLHLANVPFLRGHLLLGKQALRLVEHLHGLVQINSNKLVICEPPAFGIGVLVEGGGATLEFLFGCAGIQLRVVRGVCAAG